MEDHSPPQHKKKNSPTIVRAILLLSFLFIFPFVSWWYLKGGINFRKDALTELAVKGDLSTFSLINEEGETILSAGKNEKISVILFGEHFPDSITANFLTYHDQFKATNSVQFIMAGTFSEQWKEQVTNAGIIIIDPDQEFNQPFFSYVSDKNKLSNQPVIILVDQENQLRNTYDPALKESMSKLVTHSAVLIPAKSDRQLEFKRNQEL